MNSPRKTSLKKMLFTLIILASFTALLGIVEVTIRALPISSEFAKFLFFTEFKVDRWKYLSSNSDIHQLSIVMESFPNEYYTEQPEANRPPFDQVPIPFEVKNNSLGFRDKEFVIDPEQRQIMVLGDSIAFGKGVTQQQRFSTLIEEALPGTQVFNLGLQGCTAECMARLWKQHSEKLQPDLLLIQASGNDLDQVLWKESMEHRLPGLRLGALSAIKHSWLAQWLIYKRGSDRIQQQMATAEMAVIRYQGEFITQMYDDADRKKIPIWIINLPYAYGYYYGGHMSKLCEKDACEPEIKIDFSQPSKHDRLDEPSQAVDFVSKTARQMALTESQLESIFPYRTNYHDVVHLTPHGHAIVAEQVMEALQKGSR